MSKLRDAQTSFIVDEATKLFFVRRINDVTMSDIAKEIGIGEATLYRYFGKKANIVLKAAEKLSEKVLETCFKDDVILNGYERVESFFNLYVKLFKENKGYFFFINSLDAFIATEPDLDLSNYSMGVDRYKKIFDDSFELGLKDGSIDYDGDKDIFYRSTTLSLLNLCKKLAVEKDLLESDKMYDALNEIKTLIEIFLFRINKKS